MITVSITEEISMSDNESTLCKDDFMKDIDLYGSNESMFLLWSTGL